MLLSTIKQWVFTLASIQPPDAIPSKHQQLIPNFTTSEAGNPIFGDWYADPDNEFYNGEYWIYPTYSYAYEEQLHLDAFSSPDLVNWTKHSNILTAKDVPWAKKAIWAPAPIFRHGTYYLYFAANDIQEGESEQGIVGGIGVAVADRPEGPYKDAIGKPLIGEYHHDAQPIDQDVFIDDDDGQAYIYYGGHSHCNVAKLNDDMVSLGTFEDGSTFKEITPENYVEAPQMIKRKGIYYFMWSEGGWGGPDYAVSYAMSDSPIGPFVPRSKILQQDSAVARSSGHNGVINVPGTDIWYIIYHRRPLSETERDHREICYDRLYFEQDGTIRHVAMLVKDNFADGQMLSWHTSGAAHWAVQNQQLVGKGKGNDEGWAVLDTNFTDVVFDAVVSTSQPGVAIPGLTFRGSSLDLSDASYYWANLQTKTVQVGIAKNGAKKTLAKGDVGDLIADKQYDVRVTAIDDVISVFINDLSSPVVQTSDQSLHGGTNGVVFVGSGSLAFDDVSVSRP